MFHDVLRRRATVTGPWLLQGKRRCVSSFLIWDVYDDAAARKKFRRHSKKKFRV
jgi:hypothetical protein